MDTLNSHLDFFLPKCSLSTTASSHCTFLLLLGLCSLRTSVSWSRATHVMVSPPYPTDQLLLTWLVVVVNTSTGWFEFTTA